MTDERTAGLWVVPILPGKSEGWRRFCQELMGSRQREYVTSRQRLGIRREASWLVVTPQGELAVVCWRGSSLRRAWQEMLTSERPFDRWFRRQMEQFLDLSQVKGPAEEGSEQLYCWRAPDD